MAQYIIAYDLGTGGNKASLYDVDGNCVADAFVGYETHYPAAGWHEQRPADWWDAVVESTRRLLGETRVNAEDITCLGISGHSLGVVPLDKGGMLLRESTPIWSDSRPDDGQLGPFFSAVPAEEWYMLTGNGFPPALYSVFKIMWLRDHEPEMFSRIHKVVGTKDFINFKLTGTIATDCSYASGSGVYDLNRWGYSDRLIEASGLPRAIFPDILPSTEVLGRLTAPAAAEVGLARSVRVVAGGVDNSCMALGARAFKEGRCYNSLGSSSWIAVSSGRPLLDKALRPYVFAHVVPGMFASATAIFSAGTSFRWVRDHLCANLVAEAGQRSADAYDLMTELAAASPVGANRLLFNPSLAGGSSLDASPNVRGAFAGLALDHTQADVVRSAMEGIAMGLRVALDALRELTKLSDEMGIVGGGSKSELWRQILADAYNMSVVKTNVDQQAAALGAAALAAVGTGLWTDFERIDDVHRIEKISTPDAKNVRIYERLLAVFKSLADHQAQIGNRLASL